MATLGRPTLVIRPGKIPGQGFFQLVDSAGRDIPAVSIKAVQDVDSAPNGSALVVCEMWVTVGSGGEVGTIQALNLGGNQK